MVENRISSISTSSEIRSVEKQRIQSAQSELISEEIEQVITEENLQEWGEEGFNPFVIGRQFRPLEEQQKIKRGEGSKESASSEEIEESQLMVLEIRKAEEAAEKYQQNNAELRKTTLLLLRKSISNTDSIDDILRKVLKFYPDPSLADEALDYLLETSSGELFEKIRQVKEQYNLIYIREITAGKNISRQARIFSEQGLGSPTALRDMYRDITGNPRTPTTLFNELTSNYDFEKMRTVVRFLLHSLGADLKSKGSSIDKPELMRLLEDTRTLQAILGVFRFFQSRMRLLHSLFEKNQLSFPSNMNFEMLAKHFMSLLEERYITPDKVLTLARHLGISEEIVAQILVLSQMRDAIRQVAPRLYKNQQQKDDLLNAFIETLEELEEEWEKEEEELSRKRKKGEK